MVTVEDLKNLGLNASNLANSASNIQIIYKEVPFYLTWTFALCILLLIVIIGISLYAYFRISLRNRTTVIIHMPDKTRKVHSYKNYSGDTFTLDTNELDKEGKPGKHVYFFRPDALETGYFGRYIEYDYMVSEPRRSKGDGLKLDFKFISALLNTDLAVDLLLSAKFKEFVKTMLIICAIGILIIILIVGYQLYVNTSQGIPHCSIALTNETINSWKALQSIQ